MKNPYEVLPEAAFWAPAVAKRHMFDIAGLWAAPFRITRSSRIATYGSCFAQHFSRALVARGFTWLDAEPAPPGTSEEVARRFGYGIFSARTGNIYTTSLLRQWTEWALGETTPPDIHWEEKGRIYDPFRPAIEPDGFGSVEEMLRSRQACIDAFRRSITECNILVFTLGLTESWTDRIGGFEYPMCPGTHTGQFDPDRHVFVNHDFRTARENLVRAISLIRQSRTKGPQILLTVSPVPLTATYSGEHVLVATMESKSILRAVAGQVAKQVKGVSYFPSFEIINAPVFRGSFFEPNLRQVNPRGVAFVMETFFAGIGEQDAGQAGEEASPPRPERRKAAGRQDDVACEEELLGAFGPEASR